MKVFTLHSLHCTKHYYATDRQSKLNHSITLYQMCATEYYHNMYQQSNLAFCVLAFMRFCRNSLASLFSKIFTGCSFLLKKLISMCQTIIWLKKKNTINKITMYQILHTCTIFKMWYNKTFFQYYVSVSSIKYTCICQYDLQKIRFS